jgi:hypothetical protein
MTLCDRSKSQLSSYKSPLTITYTLYNFEKAQELVVNTIAMQSLSIKTSIFSEFICH